MELLEYNYSSIERDIENFLIELLPNINIIKRARNLIPPYELDIYLPEYNIAIECNPTYTHNSTLPAFSKQQSLSSSYHNMKTNLCEQHGIFLFHIFGYEWTCKSTIIKSMLSNLLKCNTIKYYARNLQIVKLTNSECKTFLNANHRQGYTTSSIRYGLITNDEQLVSVMTFSKMRNSIGYTDGVTPNTYELTRFCNALNTTVVGGASKLFKYFICNNVFNKIVSFSDRAHTQGNLYEVLGFSKISISRPGYVWVNYYNDTYYHRVTCQKHNLPKLFNEPNLDIQNSTEAQIMASHGYVQVFDSGVIRWEYVI